jgi:hypothetical protein
VALAARGRGARALELAAIVGQAQGAEEMSDETPSSATVVSFRDAAPSARLKTLDWSDQRAQCKHRGVEVWMKEPILECKKCGAVVDPYAWIRERCSDWEEVMADIKYKRKAAESDLNEIKKALRILRAEYKDEAERRKAERALMVLPPQMRVS